MACQCEDHRRKTTVETNLIETKIAGSERRRAGRQFGGGSGAGARARTLGGHFLPGLVMMPFLTLFLPRNEGVDLVNSSGFVDFPHVHRALEKRVHVQFSASGAMA